jgi:RraA family protein
MNPIGWRRNPSAAAADSAIVDEVRRLPVSVLSDSMARAQGAVDLRPWHQGAAPLAGTAVTVRTRAGDNLAIHRAFDFCRPGHVLVVDGEGDTGRALVGEIMSRYAESIGIAGLVIDGAIRDVGAISRRSFPVFARAASHRGPYKSGPGEINIPVSVGGMVVNPGDVVVGDADGVIAIPPTDLEVVAAAAAVKAEQEAADLIAIERGALDRSWITAVEEKLLDDRR